MRRVIVQVLGWVVLMVAAWFWLGIPESSVASLLASAALAVAIVCAAAWLLARALDAPFAGVLGWVIALGVLVGVAGWLAGYSERFGGWAAGQLSFARQKPMHPPSLATAYVEALYFMVVVTGLGLLPWVALRRPSLLRDWWYWAWCIGLVVLGWYVPSKLIGWVPRFETLTAQSVSLVLRFGAAYGIALATLLLFAQRIRVRRKEPLPA